GLALRPPPGRPLAPSPTLFRSQGGPEVLQLLAHGVASADGIGRGSRRQLGEAVPERRGALQSGLGLRGQGGEDGRVHLLDGESGDRKSTRLNSSHVKISYAVFC